MSVALPSRAELISLARAAALAHSLDPALVCAVCEQESAWNPWAIRYEPGFLARYVAPLFTAGKISATEAYARSFSWGLMQVMGQVAREHGFGVPPSNNSVIPKRLAAEGYPAAQSDAGVSASATPPPHSQLAQQGSVAPNSGTGFSLCSPGSPHPGVSTDSTPPPHSQVSAQAGASLAQLCDPATGLDIGCTVLAHKFAAAVRGTVPQLRVCAPLTPADPPVIERALQLWNGGANPDYAAQVLARLKNYL
jgi:soluble lytic murein transglycosylase-like protein